MHVASEHVETAEPPLPARVLVAEPGVWGRRVTEETLRDAGYDVVGCGGPAELPDRQCPLVESGECPLVRDANVVVLNLAWEKAWARSVLQALRERHPSTPVVAEALLADLCLYGPLFEGCQVGVIPTGAKRLVELVQAALEDRPAATNTSRARPAGRRAGAFARRRA